MGDGKVYVLSFSNDFVTTGSVSFLKAWFTRLVKVQKLPFFITRMASNQPISSERRNSNLEKRTWLKSLRTLAHWYNNHKKKKSELCTGHVVLNLLQPLTAPHGIADQKNAVLPMLMHAESLDLDYLIHLTNQKQLERSLYLESSKMRYPQR